MPEGDTLAGIARKLAPMLDGARVDRATLRSRGPLTAIEGRVIRSVTSRGKHLVVELDEGTTIVVHLGMRGRVRAYARDQTPIRIDWKADVTMSTESRTLAVFHARSVDVTSGGAARAARLRTLGPDLLDERVDWDKVLRRARSPGFSTLPVTALLLNQRVSAGIGNVYKSEALFLARLHPKARTSELGDGELVGLFRLAADLMRRNVGKPRHTVHVGSGRGELWVYGRRGRPCRICGTPIEFFRDGDHARATYFCSHCQARPKDE
jgi:endonuclease-8